MRPASTIDAGGTLGYNCACFGYNHWPLLILAGPVCELVITI